MTTKPLLEERATFNRGTGLLIIEVRCSNPNGDPDAESEPRTLEDERGLISPVSFKRKLRDLVADKDASAWSIAKRVLHLESDDDKRTLLPNTRRGLGVRSEEKVVIAKYNILETRFREREKIKKMNASDFAAEFWDARLFGNTFLESLKDDGDKEDKAQKTKTKKSKEEAQEQRESRDHFINTGVVQFGPGISVAPVCIIRSTFSNEAGVEEGKNQGMAPLAWRVVQHGVYAMPFFVNPCVATKTGCGSKDIDLMKFLIPYAYRLTSSMPRTQVEIVHAWYAEHMSPLGSCPDSLVIDAMTPKKRDKPSTSIDEYENGIPKELESKVRERLHNFEDLCEKQWEVKGDSQ
jgi:Cas7 group CRISPR-associated protein Csh2